MLALAARHSHRARPCAAGQTASRVTRSARRDSVLSSAAQRRDSVQVLAPVEVQASIAPVAGPTIGSGIPARITVLSGHDIDEWEPRILPNVLGTIAGVSIYDDLGSQYKLNVNYRGFNSGPNGRAPAGHHGVPRWRSAERGRRAGGRLRSSPDGAREARGAVERNRIAARTELARGRHQPRDGSRRGAAARRARSERWIVRHGRDRGNGGGKGRQRMGLLSRWRIRARRWMASIDLRHELQRLLEPWPLRCRARLRAAGNGREVACGIRGLAPGEPLRQSAGQLHAG